MPFICLRRTDIPDHTLQITDLWPNKSQYNAVIDPPAVGPRYINAPVTNNVVLTTGAGVTKYLAQAYTGLAAYLIVNVQATGAGGDALTPTEANAAAAAIIAAMHAGTAQTLAAINLLLVAAAGAGTELTSAGGSISTGTVMDVLRILSGVTYTAPYNTNIQTAGGVFNPQASAATWNAANFDSNILDILPTDNAFYLSLNNGKIAGFKSASFTYLGTAGAALTVYDNAGGAY
jgi:hypothetical protein